MKKALSLALVSMILVTEPLMAMETQAESTIPKELSAIGVTAEDLKDVGSAIADEPTTKEAEIMQRWRGRYCPRGYYLRVYRVRIGRFIITRYRCERFHRRGRHHWDDDRGRWDDHHGRRGGYQAPGDQVVE